MILLYTFLSSSEFIKLPGLGASPKSYIQALTENVAVLINHYYNSYGYGTSNLTSKKILSRANANVFRIIVFLPAFKQKLAGRLATR